MTFFQVEPNTTILDHLQSAQKTELIVEMVNLVVQAGRLNGRSGEDAIGALMKREDLGSTAIGGGVALPHARHESIGTQIRAFARLKKGVDFGAMDGKPVYFVFMLLTPLHAFEAHIATLASTARQVRDLNFIANLRDARDAVAIQRLLREAEQTPRTTMR